MTRAVETFLEPELFEDLKFALICFIQAFYSNADKSLSCFIVIKRWSITLHDPSTKLKMAKNSKPQKFLVPEKNSTVHSGLGHIMLMGLQTVYKEHSFKKMCTTLNNNRKKVLGSAKSYYQLAFSKVTSL